MVRWCRVWVTQGNEEPNWWINYYGNRRTLCVVQQTEAQHQDFNWGQYCRSRLCPDSGNLDPILPKNQGYNIHNNIIYHDNYSIIKLENNGRQLSSKRTRQINIRYYLITDRITKQEASVEFCPTLENIGDYFKKAIQGSKFHCFRNIILGIHKDFISAYNASGRAFIEEQKLRLKIEKEESHKAAKLAGK